MLDLDAGEAETSALSLELEAELLLMDERLGVKAPIILVCAILA